MGDFCKTTILPFNQTFPLPPFINASFPLLMHVCLEFENLKSDSATEAKYGEPMALIGLYISTASSYCCFVMLFDLVCGISQKKLWFPAILCSLNATSITVIAVAIKLPMDLSSPMPNLSDQVAKLGGLSFLCTMMSNLMPSVGSMHNKSLLANVTALSILVITMIVNVGIQLSTGVIFGYPFITMACIYMGMLFFLLLILISSSTTISTIKEVLEFKYQANLTDQIPQENLISTVEKLRKLVKRHWIMAKTGNPQFVMASTPLSYASSMICAISMTMHLFLFFWFWIFNTNKVVVTTSVYDGTTDLILVTQTFGIVVGSIAPVLRCFSILKFKWLANPNMNHFSVFNVDKYWTTKMCEWKESHLCRSISYDMHYINDLKNLILTICFRLHKVIVISCKITELIPVMVIIFAKCISCYFMPLQATLFTPPGPSRRGDTTEDLSKYVLLLDDDVPLTKYLVKRSLGSFDRIVQTAEKTQYNSLLKLLKKTDAFNGVHTFDTDQIQSLLPIEPVNSWSLPIISLTCIAITIPGIDEDVVDNLFKSVCQGIFFTCTVEKILNTEPVYVNIQKTSIVLWHEVRKNLTWLGNTLRRSAYEEKTPKEIIKLFAHTAEEIVNEFNRSTNRELVRKETNLPVRLIVANSMYRIAQTIIHTYESNNLEIIEDELFTRLSVMIADILAACLTNIPRAVIMKCNESAIEKREDSVRVAACLLERTTEIIKRLEKRELPYMDQDKMAFIDEWRLHLRQP